VLVDWRKRRRNARRKSEMFDERGGVTYRGVVDERRSEGDTSERAVRPACMLSHHSDS
jgi:hypothetical protein